MGEVDVPLSYDWIRQQILEGNLPAIGLSRPSEEASWSEIRSRAKETEPK